LAKEREHLLPCGGGARYLARQLAGLSVKEQSYRCTIQCCKRSARAANFLPTGYRRRDALILRIHYHKSIH
jgi:hypothetical protein